MANPYDSSRRGSKARTMIPLQRSARINSIYPRTLPQGRSLSSLSSPSPFKKAVKSFPEVIEILDDDDDEQKPMLKSSLVTSVASQSRLSVSKPTYELTATSKSVSPALSRPASANGSTLIPSSVSALRTLNAQGRTPVHASSQKFESGPLSNALDLKSRTFISQPRIQPRTQTQMWEHQPSVQPASASTPLKYTILQTQCPPSYDDCSGTARRSQRTVSTHSPLSPPPYPSSQTDSRECICQPQKDRLLPGSSQNESRVIASTANQKLVAGAGMEGDLPASSPSLVTDLSISSSQGSRSREYSSLTPRISESDKVNTFFGKLRLENSHLKDRNQELQEQASASLAKVEVLSGSNEELELHLSQSEDHIRELEERLNEKESFIRHLQKRIDDGQSREGNGKQLEAKIQYLEQENVAVLDRTREIAEKNSKLEKDRSAMEAKVKLSKRVCFTENANLQYAARLKVVERERDYVAGERDACRAELEAGLTLIESRPLGVEAGANEGSGYPARAEPAMNDERRLASLPTPKSDSSVIDVDEWSNDNIGDTAAVGSSSIVVAKAVSFAVQYGSRTTGLSAPLNGNFEILDKLVWGERDPRPDEDEDEDDSEKYGDGEDSAGMKRKRASRGLGSETKRKKRAPGTMFSFSPEMQDSLKRLEEASTSANWQKGTFPRIMLPILVQTAIQAITLDEYDERFFDYMSMIFPFNKSKITEFIKCTIFEDHHRLLTERQDALFGELKHQIDQGFPKVKKHWEKAGQWTDSSYPEEELDLECAFSSPRPYPLGKNLKAIIWELVLLCHEICRLRKEKGNLEGVVYEGPSETRSRSETINKVISHFPKGWMNKRHLGREDYTCISIRVNLKG
ncbi:hypothetical protein GYMLUDRAFT_260950 [Collybiopsis luxurians FD-317 M1]|uniref:Ubinuclein middle domain-containing protein n=1 Tax=Collybiopsis luxurians FD-317 M1 TaxID=944289 RepID=A0A0D0CFY3_9AGAR|nr:hypothetical protein GYMLUDRAFT_260950 [Collybiopsis luxurians FD-317 M1]